MTKKKLSHSSIQLYEMCPKAWDFKYNQGYRETILSSALFFGTAIGDTWGMMCLDKKDNLTKDEKKIVGSDPYKFFLDKMTNVKHNGEDIYIPTKKDVMYFKADLDLDLLSTDEINNELSNEWQSLVKKGYILIDAYRDEILPNIKKVHGLEIPISIKNEVGDSIIGFIDLLCEYQTDDGIKTILFDHKTASKPYPKNSIQTSQQLSLYTYDKEIDLVGYIVAIKDVKKGKIGARKGKFLQVMYESIPEAKQEEFILNADIILHHIKNNEFPKNTGKCTRWFGKTCPFYELCYNGDDSKLFKKGKK
jgi:hypothetical protein